jgi:hypothetical protein
MSDRKYRQRGYRDEPRPARSEHTPAEKKEYAPRGQPPTAPKTFNMPGYREVVRCRGCGADLHTCALCLNFDTGSPLECQQPIPVRVSPKDHRNTSTWFEARTTVERETKSAPPASARKAFDDLFK